ncbi:MAG: 2,3-bisphosphoglycerate-independent phosphoglycerate mutase [Candidatus Helarchaeota archaeon]
MNAKKVLMIVIDGVSDRPVRALNGKTPLEVAETPNLDRIAKEGMCGQLDALAPGRKGGSDTANMAILGYDPYKIYTGRGPIEVAGVGIKLQKGDVSLRCNYSTVDENMIIVNRTADYVRNGIDELEKALNKQIKLSDPNVEFRFSNSADYRCVFHLRGKGLSANISDADPYHEGEKILKIRPLDDSPEAKKTADLVNEFIQKSYDVLNKHPVNKKRIEEGKPPANIIVPRGAGETPFMDDFYQKWKLKGACIAGIGLIKGIGYLSGMEVINVNGATGYIDTDYIAKAKAALKALEKNDFILIHIEGTDEVSHDKKFKEKIKAIEKVDNMAGFILQNLPDNVILVILADHTTSCDYGDHTADPTPFVLWGKGLFADATDKFTEKAMAKGMIKRITGKDVMPIILDAMNRSKKFGA